MASCSSRSAVVCTGCGGVAEPKNRRVAKDKLETCGPDFF